MPPRRPPNQTVLRLRAVVEDSRRWLRSLPTTVRAALGPEAAPRRIILHVGLHKTGTTTLQTTLRMNRRRLAPYALILARRDFLGERLTRATRGWTPEAEMPGVEAKLTRRAQRLARWTRHAPVVIVSHEDLLGTRPTMWGKTGLYWQGPRKLGVIVRALQAAGLEVTLVVSLREIDDWTGSLQRDVTGAEDEPPVAYRARHELPESWDGLLERIATETGLRPEVVHFEEEAAANRLGDGLLRLAGVPEPVLDSLRRPPPQRVTRGDRPGSGTGPA